MKIINFGSLNIDRVYQVPHVAQPGESLSTGPLRLYAGGKGLNQSVAAARAGAAVLHAGAVGPQGELLTQPLAQAGVDVSHLLHTQTECGHAVIQVTPLGQNAILVCGGANQLLTEDYVNQILMEAEGEDIVLLQNETSSVPQIITSAHQRGLRVAFNPSPFPAQSLPYELVDCFLVNELEGAALAGLSPAAAPEAVLRALGEAYPRATVVLTLGDKGALCRRGGETLRQAAFPVTAVDATTAGDTFTGFFLAGLCRGSALSQCLLEASAAAALAVSRPGASPSIPTREEMLAFLSQGAPV